MGVVGGRGRVGRVGCELMRRIEPIMVEARRSSPHTSLQNIPLMPFALPKAFEEYITVLYSIVQY